MAEGAGVAALSGQADEKRRLLMLVQVTADHLQRGWQLDPWYCPVALAVRILGYEHVAVTANFIEVAKNQFVTKTRYHTPPGVAIRIHAIDNGETVEPFTFILDAPL
jgi:hypothetical protein